jgi:hypothetical protein
MALVHHDLCFGCGQTNLFGLLEVERVFARIHRRNLIAGGLLSYLRDK